MNTTTAMSLLNKNPSPSSSFSGATPMLELRGITTHYGAICAVNGVSLQVRRGEIVSLIGANGAGKTTLLMTVCGNPRASDGSIWFEGENITNLPTHKIMRKGIAVSPEGRRVFADMTVADLLVSADFKAEMAAGQRQ